MRVYPLVRFIFYICAVGFAGGASGEPSPSKNNSVVTAKDVIVDYGPYKGCIEVTVTQVEQAKPGDEHGLDEFQYRMKSISACPLKPGQTGVDVSLDVGDMESRRFTLGPTEPIWVPLVGKLRLGSMVFLPIIRERPGKPVVIRFR